MTLGGGSLAYRLCCRPVRAGVGGVDPHSDEELARSVVAIPKATGSRPLRRRDPNGLAALGLGFTPHEPQRRSVVREPALLDDLKSVAFVEDTAPPGRGFEVCRHALGIAPRKACARMRAIVPSSARVTLRMRPFSDVGAGQAAASLVPGILAGRCEAGSGCLGMFVLRSPVRASGQEPVEGPEVVLDWEDVDTAEPGFLRICADGS